MQVVSSSIPRPRSNKSQHSLLVESRHAGCKWNKSARPPRFQILSPTTGRGGDTSISAVQTRVNLGRKPPFAAREPLARLSPIVTRRAARVRNSLVDLTLRPSTYSPKGAGTIQWAAYREEITDV